MIMHYIAIMLEVMLVAVAVMMCLTMSQYKAKGRTLIASTGIVLAISYLVINAGEPIVWRFALFNSFDQAIHYLQLIRILTYCLDILIFLYLFFVSIKIHSKFLSSVIALSGSAKVIIEVISPILAISLILELAILIVFVIVLKQNKIKRLHFIINYKKPWVPQKHVRIVGARFQKIKSFARSVVHL